MNFLAVGKAIQWDLSVFKGAFLYLADTVPELPQWRRAKVFDPFKHHINPLTTTDYPSAVSFADIIDAAFPRGDGTLTKDTGLDFILDAFANEPKSIHSLIPRPDKRSTPGHHWAYSKIRRITQSPVLGRVFDPTRNQFRFTTTTPILAHLDRTKLSDFEALVLGLALIRQYKGQVIVPDAGFYLRDTHTYLVRENRLILGCNFLGELPLRLRSAALLITDKLARGALYDDAVLLAKFQGYRPDPDHSENDYDDYIKRAMAP
jgi:hypothetical protein